MLCIDPGYDFISNTFSLNHLTFTSRDFHAVLASHARDDHTQDIETIITLQYRLREEGIIEHRPDFEVFPNVCSEGVRWKYAPILASNKFIQFETLVPTKYCRPHRITIADTGRPVPVFSSVGITVEAMQNFHNEAPWHLNNTGVAIKVHCRKGKSTICIGYTGDTGYDSELVEFFSEADLVLIHIGDRHEKDNPVNLKPKKHLGEGGIIDMISALKFQNPKLFLFGEFGADEFITGGTDNRIEFTEHVEHKSGADPKGKRVLPADIGL